MTKADFINSVMTATGANKKDAALLVEATFGNLANAIKTDGKFSYPGFGTFSVKNRAARQGRNPQTGATIQIAASKNVGFKASSNLKGSL
jgi:DNA-binding protein HU-beta